MTLRARLTLSAALAVAAAVIIASIGVYFVVRSELRSEVDESLRERVAAVEGPPFGGKFPRVQDPLLGEAGGYFQIVAADGGQSVDRARHSRFRWTSAPCASPLEQPMAF